MAGKFEAYVDSDSFFRFRLLAPDGGVMAVSGPFETKSALAAGIAAVRECAGTGLVTDLCPAGAVARPAAHDTPAAAAQRDCGPRVPHEVHSFSLAQGPRKLAVAPRWTRAVAP